MRRSVHEWAPNSGGHAEEQYQARIAPADEVVIQDLREEFATKYCFPMLRAHAIYEQDYLLGTSIARPLIAAK